MKKDITMDPPGVVTLCVCDGGCGSNGVTLEAIKELSKHGEITNLPKLTKRLWKASLPQSTVTDDQLIVTGGEDVVEIFTFTSEPPFDWRGDLATDLSKLNGVEASAYGKDIYIAADKHLEFTETFTMAANVITELPNNKLY